MCSRRAAAGQALVAVLSVAAVWSVAAAGAAPPPAPPPELAARTRGAWIDVYRDWIGLAGGAAMAVDPGPAFCVGTDGIALVDQNAVAETAYLFVTIGGHGPFAARARAFDPRSALAAIQFHPAILDGKPCLELPADDVAPVAPGDELYALGPAGAAATPLRVKRVTPEELSFVGGLQGTFLAGSPLVDADGRLRGVLVAGAAGGLIGRERATGALAGLAKRRHATIAVPLSAASGLIDGIKQREKQGMPVPPRESVARLSRGVFPPALREAAGVTTAELSLYSASTEGLRLELLTPPSLAAQQALGTYAYTVGKTFFRWPAHEGMWEPMVVVQPSPDLEGSSGPKEATAVVERGGERFDPFDSFRECFVDYVTIETEPGSTTRRKVRGCGTFHLFPPEVFVPGADVVVRMTFTESGRTVAVPVRPETQARIAADFAPWSAALREGATTAPAPDTVVAISPPLGAVYATVGEGHAQLRITTPSGTSFVATRLRRDGKPEILIPVTRVWQGFFPEAESGFLRIGRDEISFDPVWPTAAASHAFTIPREGLRLSFTGWPRLRVASGKKHWLFDAAFLVAQPVTIGDAFRAPLKETQVGALELTARLLGDFDRALRAFDTPEILETMPSPRPAKAAVDDEVDTSNDRP
jgi:hypothetical protein